LKIWRNEKPDVPAWETSGWNSTQQRDDCTGFFPGACPSTTPPMMREHGEAFIASRLLAQAQKQPAGRAGRIFNLRAAAPA
jgi:hypothetical protein